MYSDLPRRAIPKYLLSSLSVAIEELIKNSKRRKACPLRSDFGATHHVIPFTGAKANIKLTKKDKKKPSKNEFHKIVPPGILSYNLHLPLPPPLLLRQLHDPLPP